jgi:hypothetical protein
MAHDVETRGCAPDSCRCADCNRMSNPAVSSDPMAIPRVAIVLHRKLSRPRQIDFGKSGIMGPNREFQLECGI